MKELSQKRTLLWDLDDTIGDFRGMRTGLLNPDLAQPIKLRYGMHELLNEFSEANGYQHYITSSAGLGHIGEALRRTHLDGKFTKIFGRDTVKQTAHGKHYKEIVKGSSAEERQGQMLIIGDSDRDKPMDVGGMVFMELGVSDAPHEALVIREIITSILDKGDGNFRNGFKALYEEADQVESYENDRSTRRRIDIGNDISFALEYRRAEEVIDPNEQLIPVICNIKSDSHRKPYQPFF